MERVQKCNFAKRKLKRGNPKKEIDVLDNIIEEYCLKRNQLLDGNISMVLIVYQKNKYIVILLVESYCFTIYV